MEDNWRPRFVNSKFKKLSSDLAGALEAPFSEVEVWSTIKDCGGSKAPGPDDFTFKFFKEFWDTIKADVMQVFDWFRDEGMLNKGCNSSFRTPVPKVSNPVYFSEFHPISLIGSLYKIIAKTLEKKAEIGNWRGN